MCLFFNVGLFHPACLSRLSLFNNRHPGLEAGTRFDSLQNRDLRVRRKQPKIFPKLVFNSRICNAFMLMETLLRLRRNNPRKDT